MLMTQDREFQKKSRAIIRAIDDDYDLMSPSGSVPHHRTNIRSQITLLAKKF
jgi:hypothetical protein